MSDENLQPDPILQSRFIDPPWALRGGMRLPGTGPIGEDDWILADDAFAGQMALRDLLVEQRHDAVHALNENALPAAQELLHMLLAVLANRPGYHVGESTVTRPDGVTVPVDRAAPLLTAGRLAQEDFCLLQDAGDEHVMTGAILCFPASWSLAEKYNRPLTGIHEPVETYDENVAKRVQRLFDAIRPGHPMMRANCLLYEDFQLFQPRRESFRREQPGERYSYVRTERQCLLRLPQTGAVVFSIHTTVLSRADLTGPDKAALAEYLRRDDDTLHKDVRQVW